MPSSHKPRYQTAVSEPQGRTGDCFVFQLRRWVGPRPNAETAQFHGFVYDHGTLQRLVGCTGASGSVHLFPSGEEIHVALRTKIIQFVKKAGAWVQASECPQRIGIHSFRSCPSLGEYCWSTQELFRWNGTEWAAQPFPLSNGGPFAFSDLREHAGVLYAFGYAGLVFARTAEGWKPAPSPTYQSISATASQKTHCAIAARTTAESAPGGIWLQEADRWEQCAELSEPFSIRALAFFQTSLYAIIDTKGLHQLKNGKLSPIAQLPVPADAVLSLYASESTLFLSTKKEVILSTDGATYSSIDVSSAPSLIPERT